MKNQLQGIALILFAGMLMLYAPLSPWLPILGSLPPILSALWDWRSPLRDWYGVSKRKTDRFQFPFPERFCSANR